MRQVADQISSDGFGHSTVPLPYFASSILISILTLVSSAAGIFSSGTYAREASDWALQAKAQDMANALAVATILASLYFARRGSVAGFLSWSGGLLFLIYSFVSIPLASTTTLFLALRRDPRSRCVHFPRRRVSARLLAAQKPLPHQGSNQAPRGGFPRFHRDGLLRSVAERGRSSAFQWHGPI